MTDVSGNCIPYEEDGNRRPTAASHELDLQLMYDVTTALLSVSPTGRLDLGASQEYHDAMNLLIAARHKLRSSGAVTHDESKWKK